MRCKAQGCTLLLISLPWLLIMLAVGYAWWQLERANMQAEQLTRQEATIRSLQLADAMAGQLDGLFSTIDIGLQQVRAVWLHNPTEVGGVAQAVMNSLPQGLVAYLSVVDAEGYTAFTTLESSPRTYVGDREHFISQHNGADLLLIGKPGPARLVEGWTFIANRPLLLDGQFVGTVNVSIRSDAMASLLGRVKLSESDLVALVKGDGAFLARSLDNAAAMGHSVVSSRPYLAADAAEKGFFVEQGTLDQVVRLFAWQRLPNSGLFIIVGLDQSKILAPLKLKREGDFGLVAMLTAVLFLTGVLISLLYWREAGQRRKQTQTQQSIQAINQAQSRFISGESAHSVFSELLSTLLQLTGSEYGFIGEVMHNADGQPYIKAHGLSDIAWNDETRRLYVEHVANGLDFHNMDTLFGRVVTEGKLIIANEAQTDPRGRGIPSGHPALHRFMGIPLRHDADVSGVIALANRAQPYDESLLALFQPLMTACDNLFGSMRRERERLAVEARVVELNAMLEQRVEERTAELVDQLQRNSVILNTAIDGFFAVDSNGRIQQVNPAFCAMLGYDEDEVLELCIPDIEASESPEEVAAHITKVMALGSDRFDTVHRHKDGNTIEVEVSVSLVSIGEKSWFYAFVRDIRPRKAAEDQLRQARDEAETANAAKSQFLSRMSHELRTPLNAILGFTQLLQLPGDQSLNQQQAANVQEINSAGKHLLDLVNEILDLACIESGQIAFFTEPVSLQPVIEQCVKQISPAALQRSITLTCLGDCKCFVSADMTRLRQILLNLLSNAVKYNREGGCIEIKCVVVGHQVRVSVRDTGHGLSAEQQLRLFRPFERLESAYEGIEGTGIGLALVKQLVEGMQGHVGVSSEPGTGSCFWFELPLCEPSVEKAPNEEPVVIDPPVAAGGQHIVLYIEDNQANLRLVQKILAKHKGIELLTAENGEQGLQIAASKCPQLILLDINLPGMDGFAVLKQLQATPNTKHVPVIAISANAMQGDIERAEAAGFTDYITKPIQVPAFLKSIMHCLQKNQPALDSKDHI
ncbi:ATP-binding protein [Nitrincola alkalilacustris]|uniref:ATP-binding protein n=1 Tax=Nitrincola alkalilacustris TaxID=1571224 RepID=UPI00124E5514|nr:ATP-binding protein [Nitrincola alkalilacustris]